MASWLERLRGSPAAKPAKPQSGMATKTIGLGAEGELLIFGQQDSAQTPANAISIYERTSAVSVPVNKVADSFAELSLVLREEGTKELIREHPILDMLRVPSPYFTKTLFFEALAKNYLITGECEVVALGSISREPLELMPISPQDVVINQGAGGVANQIEVTGENLAGVYKAKRTGRVIQYLRGGLAELKQIRNFSTKDGSLLRGQSPLVSASNEARQHILGGLHNVSLLEKGGRISLVFHYERDMEEDEYEETRERVRDAYGGATKAGEVAVTAGGDLEIKEIGVSNKDMDFAMLQSMARQAVALTYHVPLPLVVVDASTFNNYELATQALYDDAVIPLAGRLFGGLSDFLMPRFGEDASKLQITFDPDEITALRKRQNEELKLRKEINIETINELRDTIGADSIGDEGDVIYQSNSLIPVGEEEPEPPDVIDLPPVEPPVEPPDEGTEDGPGDDEDDEPIDEDGE